MIEQVSTLDRWFADVTGHEHYFAWQERLYELLCTGTTPTHLDLDTGLGKTVIMSLWVLARAAGANLPRRLVYVVDRRAVVDQATSEAMKIRAAIDRNPALKTALALTAPLPISTLRGQFVDNREWLADPAAPAIVIGTVDMIGSRLLFSGYGVSRKMRPYQAGLLGVDSLVVLDEAHIVPPFEHLLAAIRDSRSSDVESDSRKHIPPLRVVSLSATGRVSDPQSAGQERTFALSEAERDEPAVRTRLTASKTLIISDLDDEKQLAERLAIDAWKLSKEGELPIRCLIFCDRRKNAESMKSELDKLAKKAKQKVSTELFVGARRVKERENAAAWLKDHGFIADSASTLAHPAFLVATSAAEVGVDLDADHIVCDLVPWERMVQRLGRVNRRGTRDDTQVLLAVAPRSKPKKGKAETKARSDDKGEAESPEFERTRKLLEQLPPKGDGLDASPQALFDLRNQVGSDAIAQASTPEPLYPPLTRAEIEAWSMTSLREHPGRPKVGPWLRGWVDGDPPQTSVIWRTHLPVRMRGGRASENEIEEFFEAAPPHASEILETDANVVKKWLLERAKKLMTKPSFGNVARSEDEDMVNDDEEGVASEGIQRSTPPDSERVVAIVLDGSNDFVAAYTLGDFQKDEENGKGKKQKFEQVFAGNTVVVDACLAGLKDGLLDAKCANPPATADDGGSEWLPEEVGRPAVGYRVRNSSGANITNNEGHETFAFVTARSDEGEPLGFLLVDTWKTEDSCASSHNPQLLDDHQHWTERSVKKIANALNLCDDIQVCLALAAGMHDEGKRSSRWQSAFNARRDGQLYAKTRGPVNTQRLAGYRHEFGSLKYVERGDRFTDLSADQQQLVLHLVAAHHGRARPGLEADNCDDAPPYAHKSKVQKIVLDFADLQRRWGPWGLAWLESLVRAADQQASRENDSRKIGPGGGDS